MNPINVAATVAAMPDWARRTVYWSAGALFLAGFGMSFYYLTQLAMWFGAPWWVAWLLPLALDAGAVVGVMMWVTGGDDSDVERFGRALARQMIVASVIGNALDRAITFAPGAAVPTGGEHSIAALLDRTQALATVITGGPGPDASPNAGALALLVISMAIGIVFPILAYRMAHALILVRKAADATRTAPAPAEPRTVADAVPGAGTTAEQDDDIERETDQGDADTGPLPRVGDPYDTTDYDPGTPAWLRRYEALPGNTKVAKLESWLSTCWDRGEEPVLTPRADRVVDGNRTSSTAKRRLAARGIVPPSERTADRELTHV